MKNKVKGLTPIILVILVIVVALGIFINSKNEEATQTTDEKNLVLVSAPLENEFFDSYNEKNLSYDIATIDGDLAYSVDYGCDTAISSLKFKDYLSDQGMAVLMNGYPSKTFKELGCANEEEAYLATQMALWEILNRTGESEKATETFRVENVTSVSEEKASYDRMMKLARQLVKLGESEPYDKVPTLHIGNGNVTYTLTDEEIIIGPYSADISDDAEFKSIMVSLIDAPESAKIVDENGVEKSILANGETVYIIMNRSEEECTFKIKFEAYANRIIGEIYEVADSNAQDYVKLSLEPISMEKELSIEFTKVTTKGRIELVVGDEDNKPVAGSEFELIDQYGNLLMKVQTGKDGVVDFYDVPEGEYTLKQISALEGYKIKEESKKVNVVAGELVTVKFIN